MTPRDITDQLRQNAQVFRSLFTEVPEALITWKPSPNDWCLLEIACHLRDEEGEDFRARIECVFTDPQAPLPAIDPQAWVSERDYLRQAYAQVVDAFLQERSESLARLDRWCGTDETPWNNAYQHPTHGPLSAHFFLENWLAHDLLHIRQINRRRYGFLGQHAQHPLDYAGEW